MHLVVDGYGAAPDKLRDMDLIRKFLDKYPATIGMTKISPPQVHIYHGQVPKDWGVSGFVLIAESHISIHTFPDRGYINIDIFSCKEFNVASSLSDVQADFSLNELRVWTLNRGTEYSTPKSAYQGMIQERESLLSSQRGDDA